MDEVRGIRFLLEEKVLFEFKFCGAMVAGWLVIIRDGEPKRHFHNIPAVE